MKTLNIAMLVAALLVPLSRANAGDDLRMRLDQARQVLQHDFQVIEQESRLFQATALPTRPAIQAEKPVQISVSLADLCLPGKAFDQVLTKKTSLQNLPDAPSFTWLSDLNFSDFNPKTPAAK